MAWHRAGHPLPTILIPTPCPLICQGTLGGSSGGMGVGTRAIATAESSSQVTQVLRGVEESLVQPPMAWLGCTQHPPAPALLLLNHGHGQGHWQSHPCPTHPVLLGTYHLPQGIFCPGD